MTQSLSFTGKVVSPAGSSGGIGCSPAELAASLDLELEPVLQEFARVLGGQLDLPSTPAFIVLPVVSNMTTVSFLALSIDEDSTPITVYVGTTPANEGSFQVTSDLVLTPNGKPGAQFWVKGGAATLKLIVAGT